MIGQNYIAWRMANKIVSQRGGARVPLRCGEEIFADGPYPHSFTEFIGQNRARLQLLTAMTSAQKREKPLDHILLASGIAGIGKTALAKLCAFNFGVGIAEVSGSISEKDIRPTLRSMQPGDVLFIDEVHRMVSRGKARAEWLLHLLQDGVLVLPTGVERVPPITVIAATTDAGKLPETILSRFPIQPILDPYSEDEAVLIAKGAATRLGFGTDDIPWTDAQEWLVDVVTAADRNPRRITTLLMTLRDVILTAGPNKCRTERGYDISTALNWTGLTPDGLSRLSQEYLVTLYALDGQTGIGSLRAALSTEVLTHIERELIQRGYINITPRGRVLTPYGWERAEELAKEIAEPA